MDVIEVEFEPTVEVLPPAIETRAGDTDRGLKVIRVASSGPKNGLEVVVEGLAGESYELPLFRNEKVSAVEGAELAAGRLIIRMPGTPGEGFVRHVVRLAAPPSRL